MSKIINDKLYEKINKKRITEKIIKQQQKDEEDFASGSRIMVAFGLIILLSTFYFIYLQYKASTF